jgi:hypothetical protein
MQHTLPPPPSPQAPAGDTFYQDVLRWGARVLLYPFYRPVTDLPHTWGRRICAFIGRVILMAGVLGIIYRLGQHVLLTVALAHHQRSDPPLPPMGYFPLAHPLTPWQIAALLAGLMLLLALDRQTPAWPIHLAWKLPPIEIGRVEPQLRLPVVPPELLVLGRPYRRTWNEMTNAMDETPLEDTVYTASLAELCTHATVVAPTRAGKTFNITIPLIEFTDRLEGAGIFIDAKGDDLTGPKFDGLYPGAFHRRFNLRDFEHSFRLQLWVGQTIEERAERLAACLIAEGTSEEGRYFSNSARGAFTNLVLAHHAVYGQEPTIPQVLKYLRNADSRTALSRYLPKDSDLGEALVRITELRSGKTDALGGLDGTLDPLAKPNIARFFAGPGEGHTIEELLQAQARVCFTLPTGPMPVAKILGRLVISQFTQVVLDAENNTEYLKLLVVEDAVNFITPTFGTAMAQASSHTAAYVLIFQDLAQVRDEALIQDILTNSGFKIVLGGIGDADSARFSKLFGSRERLFRTQTASSGRGQGQSQSSGSHRGAGSSQRGDNQSRQHSVGWGLAPRSRPDFTATDLRYLPDHHAVIERRDNVGHLTPATLIHFDADLVRTLTLHQRQELLGPDAEPLNHLQPIFTSRQADDTDAASTEEKIAGEAEATEEPASTVDPNPGATTDASASRPSEADTSLRPAASAPDPLANAEPPTPPAATASTAQDETADVSPTDERSATPGSERNTTPLPTLGTEAGAADTSPAGAPDARIGSALPVEPLIESSAETAPTDVPSGGEAAPASSEPERSAGTASMDTSSNPVSSPAPDSREAPDRVSAPSPQQAGSDLAKPASSAAVPVQGALPLPGSDSRELPEPALVPVPAYPDSSAPLAPGDTPLDAATAAEMLIKQVGSDTGSATLLAGAAIRGGYTTATFTALINQVCALPESMNPRGVVYQQLARYLPMLDSTDSPSDDYLT